MIPAHCTARGALGCNQAPKGDFVMYTVYSPSFGYGLAGGKTFHHEYLAKRLVRRLRKAGHAAWMELAL